MHWSTVCLLVSLLTVHRFLCTLTLKILVRENPYIIMTLGIVWQWPVYGVWECDQLTYSYYYNSWCIIYYLTALTLRSKMIPLRHCCFGNGSISLHVWHCAVGGEIHDTLRDYCHVLIVLSICCALQMLLSSWNLKSGIVWWLHPNARVLVYCCTSVCNARRDIWILTCSQRTRYLPRSQTNP